MFYGQPMQQQMQQQMQPTAGFSPAQFMYQNAQGNQMGQMQPVQGRNVAARNNFDFVPVNTVDDVKSYFVEQGTKVWFRFQNDPVIAVKLSDGYNPSEIHYFRIEEFDPSQQVQQTQTADTSRFVSVDYLEQRLKEMEGQFLDLFAGMSAKKEAVVNE